MYIRICNTFILELGPTQMTSLNISCSNTNPTSTMPRSADDPIAQAEQSHYHSPIYSAMGAAQMSFRPINQIHQHLCGLHIYAHDTKRAVRAHHFCTHLRHDLHQCVIYDSDQPNARLIGIEYLIPESVFVTLPADEKKV